MGRFHLFRQKQVLSETEQKLNALWDSWAKGKVESPYQELMTYESEVNNGGHDQYFFNLCHAHECDLSKCAELQKQLTVLFSALPIRFAKLFAKHTMRITTFPTITF